MENEQLSVRELSNADISLIADYWLFSDPDFLTSMGVDLVKIPSRTTFTNMLVQQLSQDYHQKQSYCIIWELNDEAIGHSNANKIVFGEEAYMHLHIWKPDVRHKGYGSAFIKMTLPYFFTNLELKSIYCEPYALNPSPNKTLEKIGFVFLKKYMTTPGAINFEQEVNLWRMDKDRFF